MPKAKLDHAFCLIARCEGGKKKTDFYDEAVTGFVLECRSTGGKTYYLRYQDQAGKQQQHKIGGYADITFAAAKKAAQRLRSDVVMGGNPSAKKAEAKAVPIYAELAAQHMADAKLHQRSYSTTEMYMRRHIVTRWGRVRLTDIDPRAVAQWLFAAADEAEDTFSPEGIEPAVALTPMSDGREVVEDYRSLQLSLRAHPLTFLRTELTRRGVVPCADLARIKDGRHVEVAGIILVRQKPGSAKGVLFITIEDETGIANGILWPDRFEAQRRTVMSAAMIGMKGRVQREGEVIHVICDRIVDHGDLLSQVGQMSFPHATGRGDGARHAGAPDRGDPGWRPGPRDSYWPPHAAGMDPEEVVRVKTRDFR